MKIVSFECITVLGHQFYIALLPGTTAVMVELLKKLLAVMVIVCPGDVIQNKHRVCNSTFSDLHGQTLTRSRVVVQPLSDLKQP